MANTGMNKSSDLIRANGTTIMANEVQDLRDVMELTCPKDTPLTTLLMSKGKFVPAYDVTVSWREKELNGTRATALKEGAEAGEPIKSSRQMYFNYCQILEKVYGVSGTMSKLNPLGIADVKADEMADRLAELKRDLEYYFINGTKTAEGSSGRQMAGLISLINTGHHIDVNGKPFNVDTFVDGMQKLWDKGAQGDIYVFANAQEKRKINAFLDGAGYTRVSAETGQNSIGILVDKIETDFGTCNIVLDRFLPEGTIMGVDLDMVEVAELRPIFSEDLAKTGDYIKGHLIVENTIKLYNQYAGFVIKNIHQASAGAKAGK